MSMKRLIPSAILICTLGLQAQETKTTDNAKTNEPVKESIPRYVEYTSIGEASAKADGKVENTKLIRKLKYTAMENRSKQMHEFILEDGTATRKANTMPDKCQVINKESGLTVDEYTIEFTCDKHFGAAPYRDVINKLMTKYATQFKDDIKNSKGILYVTPSQGEESIEYKSPRKMNVRLVSGDVEYIAVANIDDKNKILATHSFKVTDRNRTAAGVRTINVVLDFSPETQKMIEDLARYAVNETGIVNGTRKQFISNASDVLEKL